MCFLLLKFIATSLVSHTILLVFTLFTKTTVYQHIPKKLSMRQVAGMGPTVCDLINEAESNPEKLESPDMNATA